MSKALAISQEQIENQIFTVRGLQVMLDYHLAELYDADTKRINEQVKRNIRRFPQSFMFQLSAAEWKLLQSQIATTEIENNLRSQIATAKRRTLPYVFTEQGVAMLSAVLNSETAITVSILIMDAFVKMRRILLENTLIHHRLEKIELKQLALDVKKANDQYAGFELKTFTHSHDRFLIIDQTEVYHLGASLKDLGKKPVVSEVEPWFAFSKLDKSSVSIVNQINELI